MQTPLKLDPKMMREKALDYVAYALRTLARIHQDQKVPAKERVRAAEIILDHALGKPAQAVVMSDPDGKALAVPATINWVQPSVLPPAIKRDANGRMVQ